MRTLRTVIMLLLCTLPAFSQTIRMNPKMLFIDPNRKIADLEIINSTNKSVEVAIGFMFTYPEYDSVNGDINMVLADSNNELFKYSLEPYIKVYPKKFILKPFGNQIVKFLIVAKKDMLSALYWTRVAVVTKNAFRQIDSSMIKQDTITVSYGVKQETQTAIFYPNGFLEAGIKINNMKHTVDSNTVSLIAAIEKSGNKPYWGNYLIEVRNKSTDEVVDKQGGYIPVYMNLNKKFKILKDKVKPGDYVAKVKIISGKRENIPDIYTKDKPVELSYEFKVP